MKPAARNACLAASCAMLVAAHPFAFHDAAFLGGGPLAWVALVPWWLAIRTDAPRDAMRRTWWTMTFFFLGLAAWLYVALHDFGGLTPLASVSGMGLLACWLAVFPAAAAGVARASGSAFVLPVAWAATEWLRGILFTGLPWGNLGYTQWRFPAVAQLAEVAGVHGVAALVVLVNVAIAEAIATRRGRPALAILAILPVLLFGVFRMRAVEADRASRPSLRVALAQGNISQDQKHDRAFDDEVRRRYNFELLAAEKAGADLAVWPEAAIPAAVHVRSAELPQSELYESNATWLLAGAATYWDEDGQRFAHNSALLVAPGRVIAGRYDKSHLVPFGEYVPMRRILFFLERLTQGVGNFLPGDSHRPLVTTRARLGVLICYEDIFPDVARAFAANGADVLVNITNDAWYGHGSAAWQHASMVVFRAIENRRAVVRAAQTGISQVVDPAGRIVATTQAWTGPVSLVADVPIGGPQSLYVHVGEWFAAACLGASVACVRMLPRRARTG